jgi:hypothetical protein
VANRWYGVADVRHPRVAARAVLIAALALVAVPAVAGSRTPSLESQADIAQLKELSAIPAVQGAAAVTTTLDLAYRSAGSLEANGLLAEPAGLPGGGSRPTVDQPAPAAKVIPIWHYDRNISFYGPGFYGRRTACGYALTKTLIGVAHRTLPCGTMVTFRNPYNGISITVPVVDRGPYVSGRQWDLTGGACLALRHCYTGSIYWKFP